jgi:hypothetical protein
LFIDPKGRNRSSFGNCRNLGTTADEERLAPYFCARRIVSHDRHRDESPTPRLSGFWVNKVMHASAGGGPMAKPDG